MSYESAISSYINVGQSIATALTFFSTKYSAGVI